MSSDRLKYTLRMEEKPIEKEPEKENPDNVTYILTGLLISVVAFFEILAASLGYITAEDFATNSVILVVFSIFFFIMLKILKVDN